MAWPVVSPRPGKTLSTPSGTPASRASSASRSTESGVCSAGFTMHEQPAASAGASFQAAISNGKFQGRTSPTTPAGSLTISARLASPVGATLPKALSASSAYHWKKFGTSLPISCRQSVIVLPLSRLSRTASSLRCARTRPASRSKTCLRSSGAARDQMPSSKTLRAAATARSTSAAVACATAASTAPVAGLIVSNLPPSEASVKAPAMNSRVSGTRAAAMARVSSAVNAMAASSFRAFRSGPDARASPQPRSTPGTPVSSIIWRVASR
jgi:hypothetical protein